MTGSPSTFGRSRGGDDALLASCREGARSGCERENAVLSEHAIDSVEFSVARGADAEYAEDARQFREAAMTQQYIVGEFSSLLADLESASRGRLSGAVDLRRSVERAPLCELPELAHEAMELTDTGCWAALEEGDASAFNCCATSAAALRDFAEAAGLMP